MRLRNEAWREWGRGSGDAPSGHGARPEKIEAAGRSWRPQLTVTREQLGGLWEASPRLATHVLPSQASAQTVLLELAIKRRAADAQLPHRPGHVAPGALQRCFDRKALELAEFHWAFH